MSEFVCSILLVACVILGLSSAQEYCRSAGDPCKICGGPTVKHESGYELCLHCVSYTLER